MKKLVLLVAFIAAPFLAQGQTSPAQPSSDKSWNITFSPVAFLVGVLNADADYAVNENWTVGPQFVYMNLKIDDLKLEGSSFGGHARYYFDGVFKDGWYGAVQLSSFSLEIEDEVDGDNAKASAVGYSLGGGYHWFWDSFNLRLGLTLGGTTAGEIEIKDAGGNVTDTYTPTINTGLDFAIGFTF